MSTKLHTPGWPDAVEGLHALKKLAIIATLSNGNVRLLIDMVNPCLLSHMKSQFMINDEPRRNTRGYHGTLYSLPSCSTPSNRQYLSIELPSGHNSPA